MQISVILAHPDTKSFNYAIAQKAVDTLHKNGHEVYFHDLYREDFPPVIPAYEIPRNASLPAIIKTHCDESLMPMVLLSYIPTGGGSRLPF